jgi:hypothetical protein
MGMGRSGHAVGPRLARAIPHLIVQAHGTAAAREEVEVRHPISFVERLAHRVRGHTGAEPLDAPAHLVAEREIARHGAVDFLHLAAPDVQVGAADAGSREPDEDRATNSPPYACSTATRPFMSLLLGNRYCGISVAAPSVFVNQINFRFRRQGVQDIDRPPKVETLPEPAGACRACGDAKSMRVVTRSQNLHRILRCRGRWRHLGQQTAVRPLEAERSVGLARHLVAFLVHGAVMPPTEKREIRERGRAAVRPVVEVMSLAEAYAAAREAAAPVAMMERAPQGRRDRPGSGSHFHDSPVLVVSHHDSAGIAGEAPRSFRGNARAVFKPVDLHGESSLCWNNSTPWLSGFRAPGEGSGRTFAGPEMPLDSTAPERASAGVSAPLGWHFLRAALE